MGGGGLLVEVIAYAAGAAVLLMTLLHVKLWLGKARAGV